MSDQHRGPPADHPGRQQLRLVRPLLPFVQNGRLLGPILLPNVGNPTWELGEVRIIASVQQCRDDDSYWYHVSYSRADRVPSHEESLSVRTAMFRPEALVVAVFPPADEYVNVHPNCLHLWQRLTGDRLIPDLRLIEDGVLSL